MEKYESPTLTKVGTVADLTQGHISSSGQDALSWITIRGHQIFGS